MKQNIKTNQFASHASIINQVSLMNNQETILSAVNNLVPKTIAHEAHSNINTNENVIIKSVSNKAVKKAKKQRPHYRKGYFRTSVKGKTTWVNGKIIHEREYYKLRTEAPTNYYNRMNQTNTRIRTLFSYTGGKSRFYKQTQFLWNEMIDQKRVKRILVPFLGGGSDFLSIAVKAIESEVKTVIVNDLNPIIANLIGHIKNNREKLKAEVVSFGDIKFSSSEEKKLYLEMLAGEANKIEIQGNYSSIELAALFLILLNNSHKGLYHFNGTKSRYSIGLYGNERDKLNFIDSYMDKINFYGYFIDQFQNFIIENRSYNDVIADYDGVHTLIVADPLYVEEKHDETEEVVLRQCTVDYGFRDFDHDHCFEVFSNVRSQLIYHNSYNTVLINKFKQCSNKNFLIVEKKGIGKTSEQKQKKSVEVIFYTDKRVFIPEIGQIQINNTVAINAINNAFYRPLVIAA